MKNRIAGFGRALTSALILLCLMFGIFAPTVIAAEDSAHTHEESHESAEAVYGTDASDAAQALRRIYEVLSEKLGEAVRYALRVAYENGYVDSALEALTAAAEKTAITKGDVASLSDEAISPELKAAVLSQLDEAINTINKAKELVSETRAEDIDDLIALVLEFEEDLYRHLRNAGEIVAIVNPELAVVLDELWDGSVAVELDKFIADIEANWFDYLIEALKDGAKVFGPLAWEALLATPDGARALVRFIEEYAPYVADFFEEYGADFISVFGNIAVEYGIDTLAFIIDQGKEGLLALGAIVDRLGEEAWDVISVFAESLALEAEVVCLINFAVVNANEQIDILCDLLSYLEGELENIEKALLDAVDEAQQALYKQLEAVNAKIEKVSALIAELRDKVSALVSSAESFAKKIQNIVLSIKELANAVMEGTNEAIVNAFYELRGLLEEFAGLFDALKDALGTLPRIVDQIIGLANKLEDAATDLTERLYAFAEYLKELSDRAVIDAAERLTGIVADVAANAAYIVEKLSGSAEMLGEALDSARDAANRLNEKAEELYRSALAGEYTFDRASSRYVAIGDAFAANGALSFVDFLAERFTMNETHYADLTGGEFGFTEEEALEFIDEYRDYIADSDLITFGYNNISVFNSIISMLGDLADLTEGTIEADVDWAALFGEETAEIIETVIDNLESVVAEELVKALGEEIQSMDTVALTALAADILEIYVYAYISRMATIHKVIAELRATSPDALIVIVGAFNDFEGLVFNSKELGLEEEFVVDMGQYVGYVVDALNASAFISAFFDKNTIFVSTEGVEKELDTSIEGEPSIMDYLSILYAPDLLLPSTDGNADIADRIMAALSISFADHTHEYDNRCDRTCNTCGDERYAEHSYSNACDKICNVCGYERDDAADHLYDADCDATCNICGESRVAAAHTFGSWKTDRESTYNMMGRKSRACTKCGYTEYEYIPVLVAEGAKAKDSSAGLVIAITIPSIFALTAGGFSAYWFGAKKRTVKELGSALRALASLFKR